jgi:hypothetical protein
MHRDFDAMLAEAGGRPTFTIGGQTFTCRAKLPWRKFTSLLAVMTGASEAGDGAQATEGFLTAAVVAKDRARWIELLNLEDNDDDDTVGISPGEINELAEWLMEYYTGKRSGNAESSSAGPSSTGQSRKVVSLNPRKATG